MARVAGLARALLAASLLTLAIVGFHAASAGAVLVQPNPRQAISYMAAPSAAPGPVVSPFTGGGEPLFTNVTYGGGPVMASNTNYAFYWDPPEAPAYPADYRPAIDGYFEDLAHDSGGQQNTDSVAAQYGDAAGQPASYDSHFAGAILDTDPYPANGCERAPICLTDGQIRAELAKYLAAHELPEDLAHEYFVLTPPGVEGCLEAAGEYCSAGILDAAYCAYHSDIPVTGGAIVYADDPYVDETICDDGNHPNGTTADATLSAGLSHEHVESLTDPEPDSGWTQWSTAKGRVYEVADKCRTFEEASEFGTPLGVTSHGAEYNQLIDGHPYWYQREWSDAGHACMQRLSPGDSPPSASFTVKLSGQEASFDASASGAPGGVAQYDWQFGEGSPASVQSAAPTISHIFSQPGSHEVALTVFASDGSAGAGAQTVSVGGPAVSKLSPTKGPAAGSTAVRITGSGFSDVSAVRFGSTPAKKFDVESLTRITATSPPLTAGTLDVTVTTAAGTSPMVAHDRFKTGPPTVTSLSPAGGPASGGTKVEIAGSGFAPGENATVVQFGGAQAGEVSCSSTTACTAVAPAQGKPRTVEVRASVGKVTSRKSPPGDSFAYTL